MVIMDDYKNIEYDYMNLFSVENKTKIRDLYNLEECSDDEFLLEIKKKKISLLDFRIKNLEMKINHDRNNFSDAIKKIVKERANYLCSRCNKPTQYPSENDNMKVGNYGVVSHIYPAVNTGPRCWEWAKSGLSSEFIYSVENAIFLCCNCACIIDTNQGENFSSEKLFEMKKQHEEKLRAPNCSFQISSDITDTATKNATTLFNYPEKNKKTDKEENYENIVNDIEITISQTDINKKGDEIYRLLNISKDVRVWIVLKKIYDTEFYMKIRIFGKNESNNPIFLGYADNNLYSGEGGFVWKRSHLNGHFSILEGALEFDEIVLVVELMIFDPNNNLHFKDPGIWIFRRTDQGMYSNWFPAPDSLYDKIILRMKKFRGVDLYEEEANALVELEDIIKTPIYSVLLTGQKKTSFLENNGHVTELKIDGISLEIFPDQINKLEYLTYLNVSQNLLTQLPDALYELKFLKILHLSSNKIKKISQKIGNFKYLNELSLCWNELNEIPEEMGQLEKIKILNISGNKITQIPKKIGNLSNLTHFKLHNNEIEHLPKELKDLSNLTEIEIHHNYLAYDPITKEVINHFIILGIKINYLPQKD